MIPSMFSLDHRLAELRPTGDDLRVARELRDATEPSTRQARTSGVAARSRLGGAGLDPRLPRLATR